MTRVRQQINLYQPVAERAGSAFGSRAAGWLLLTVGLGMLVVWGIATWRVAHLERAVHRLREQQQQQAETLRALQAARASGMSPEQAATRVSALTAELAAHERVLARLRDGSLGLTGGFSGRLRALAQGALDGLWLDHIAVSGLTGAVDVGGAAVRAELIPAYLQGLRDAHALRGAHFDRLVIEAPSAEQREADAPTGEDKSAAAAAFRFRAESGAPPPRPRTGDKAS